MYSNKKSIWKSLVGLIGIVSIMGGSAYFMINYSRPADLYDGFYYETKKHLTKKEGFEWKPNNRVFFNYSKNNIDLDNKIISNS
ncbi:MAG: hypothetical protein E7Y34_02390, partial [Mycoplasma sp.]|nr:hypothetical protein [Mycoplasma sp.]